MVKRKLVVAALAVNDRGEVLVTRRLPDQPLGGFWELPGGKIEDGEGPEAALAREIREELGCEIVIGRPYDVMFHRYPTYDVLMIVYTCRLTGEPRPLCVADLAWAAPADLARYEILPADAPIVARLVAEGPPTPPKSAI